MVKTLRALSGIFGEFAIAYFKSKTEELWLRNMTVDDARTVLSESGVDGMTLAEVTRAEALVAFPARLVAYTTPKAELEKQMVEAYGPGELIGDTLTGYAFKKAEKSDEDDDDKPTPIVLKDGGYL